MNVILFTVILFMFSFFYSFICAIICNLRAIELREYLKQNYYEKWKDLTSFNNFFGPGMNNPLKLIPYIYNNEQSGDEKILQYKDNIKIILKYWYIGLGVTLINLVCLVLLFVLYKSGILMR